MSTAARKRRIDWRPAVGILLSLVGLYFALRGVSLGKVAHEIASANPFWYLGAIVTTTFPFWLRSWRWKSIIVPVYPRTRFHNRFACR